MLYSLHKYISSLDFQSATNVHSRGYQLQSQRLQPHRLQCIGCSVCCCREIIIILLIILVTGLTAISLIHAKERNILREKIHNMTEIGNIRNEKLNQLTKDVESASTYHKIGEFGYFQNLNRNKTYAEGQKACSRTWGHIVEFSTSTTCKTNRKSKCIITYVL